MIFAAIVVRPDALLCNFQASSPLDSSRIIIREKLTVILLAFVKCFLRVIDFSFGDIFRAKSLGFYFFFLSEISPQDTTHCGLNDTEGWNIDRKKVDDIEWEEQPAESRRIHSDCLLYMLKSVRRYVLY